MPRTLAAHAARLTLAASLTLVAACGGSGGEGGGGGGAGASPPRKLDACKYDFQANVTQGADSGLSLHGSLVLAADGDGAFGTLTADGVSQPIPTAAAIDGENIKLQFSLSDDTVIEGTGSLSGTLAQCSGMMTGTLTGPAPGDTGNWLAQPQNELYCETQCAYHPPTTMSCNGYCEIIGYMMGTPKFETCFNNCLESPAIYLCSLTDGSLASFFQPCEG